MINRVLKIGVTGGIGSGKTTVCTIFNILGIPIYNADIRAKMLMVHDDLVVKSIKKQFGDNAYTSDGSLNRVYLANHVFKNEKELGLLNEIVHPAVATDFEQWSDSQVGVPYVIKEAALLVEAGSYKSLDHLISVVAPEEIRISRVLARDNHRSAENVREIISNQLDDEQKVSKSTFVITNDAHNLVIPQVLKIHQLLINSSEAG